MQTNLYFACVLLTCVVTGWLAFYAWRQRSVPGARAYAALALCECLLALTEMLSMLSPGPAAALFWFNTRFIFTGTLAVLFLVFALEYNGHRGWLSRRLIAGAFIIPILTQFILWSNALPGLWLKQEVSFYQSGPFWLSDTSARIPGLWFLVHSFYSLLLLVAGIVVILVTAWRRPRLDRGQALLLSAGALIAFITSLIPIFNLAPPGGINPFIPGVGASTLLCALAIFRFQFLKRSPAMGINPQAPPLKVQENHSQALFFLIFLVLVTGISAIGYLSYKNYESQNRAQVESQLASIGALKVSGLQDRRSERLADAEIFYKNSVFSALALRFLTDPADFQAQTELQTWLKAFNDNPQYDRVSLLDAGGVERISYPLTTEPLAAALAQAVTAGSSAGQVTFVDFYRDAAGGSIHLALVVPILANQANLPLGFLVLRIDPQAYLYPFIKQWPAPSASAETLLVRRDGADALFLNNLRFQSNTALNLRISLASTQTPAVKAVLGQTGVVEGSDYRGAAVIADVRPVPDSPWFLVSRIDTAEVYGPLQERLWQTIAFAVTLILAGGGGLALVWRQQQVRSYQASLKAAEALRRQNEYLTALQDTTLELLSQMDPGVLFENIVRRAGLLMGTSSGCLDLVEPESGLLKPQVGMGALAESFAHQVQPGEGVAGIVWQTGQPLVANDYDHWPGRIGSYTTGLLASVIGVPLLYGGQVLGVLGLGHDFATQRTFEPGDVEILTQFGRLAAIAIENTRLLSVVQQELAERKHAEQELVQLSEHQQALLSAVPDIIMEVDLNKVYTWANQAGSEFFGEDVVGKEAAFYFVGEEDIYRTVEPLFSGDQNKMYIETWQRRKDGENRLLAWWCQALKDDRGKVTGTLSSARDISEQRQQETQILAARVVLQELLANADQSRRALLSVVEDQKMAQEEILRLNTDLERRVADRTAQLEASNKELEAFAYSVSHDLRAPLRAIDGFSRILQQEYVQKLDEEGLRLLGVVRDNTNRMDQLITDLLALSRVGRSELRYSPIDMTTLANSIYHELATPEVLEKFVFRVSDLPPASGDPTLMRQVWANLISNAIKYTSPKAECVIEISGWKKDGLCTYVIKDSGVGFDPKYTDKLFGLFQRLHKAGEFEGTGVGLAIVQRIIHRHGGQVWGEGQVGAGATFYFTLPERQVNHESI